MLLCIKHVYLISWVAGLPFKKKKKNTDTDTQKQQTAAYFPFRSAEMRFLWLTHKNREVRASVCVWRFEIVSNISPSMGDLHALIKLLL